MNELQTNSDRSGRLSSHTPHHASAQQQQHRADDIDLLATQAVNQLPSRRSRENQRLSGVSSPQHCYLQSTSTPLRHISKPLPPTPPQWVARWLSRIDQPQQLVGATVIALVKHQLNRS